MFKFLCAAMACMGVQVSAQTPLQDRLTGDLGIASYNTQNIVQSDAAQNFVMPYAYFDYGRFYTRVDTLGWKTTRLGMGYLELAARISFEGFKTDAPRLSGVQARANPVPIGLGTYQETPWGAFFVYGLYDTTSGGFLQEATYAAEFKVGAVTVYPQLGVEQRSRKYVQHLYGVSKEESQNSAHGSYTAGASTTPVMAMALEWPLDEAWHLNVQLRRRWLDAAITQSPLVSVTRQDSGFVAVTRSFK